MTLGESEALPIGLDLESDKPSGTIAITNARIITMNGDEVIQNGTIVIHENRIEAVGAANEVDVPEGAYVMDAAGRSEEHTSELQSRGHLVCRLLLEKKRNV